MRDRTAELLARFDKGNPSECWPWRGQRHGTYGRFEYLGERPLAHRAVYEHLVGPIPDGLVLDHLCRNTNCVNPSHLEPVPNAVNVLRGVGAPAQNRQKTHCKHGHPLAGDNLIVRKDGRECRECQRIAKRRWRAKQRAEAS